MTISLCKNDARMKTILRIAPDRARAVPGKSITGRISPEARRRSAQNATHNAELAEMIVLSTESVPGFIELLSQLQEELQPESFVESRFVDVMAAAHWRRMRYWLIEKTLTAPGFPAAPGQSRALLLLKRFQSSLRRQYQRTFEAFKTYRACRTREAAGSPKKDVFRKRTQFRTNGQPVPVESQTRRSG
jgi:hypothetical protein